MKKILVIGSHGQLGSEIHELSGNSQNYIFTTSSDLDIRDKDAVDYYIKNADVDTIINCAAYTNVDGAETDQENAKLVNTIGPKNLASAALKYNAKLIHISTDYVFNGDGIALNGKKRPYREDDATSPCSVYGSTKLAGEEEIIKSHCQAIIIRTAWLYSAFGKNFVKTMRRLGQEKAEISVVNDQYGSPTYAKDLAMAISAIVEQLNEPSAKPHYGKIFHYSNKGVCSWYDFAVKIMSLYNLDCHVKPISSDAYPTPTKRPAYSVLDKKLICKTFNLTIPDWEDSLKDLVKRTL